MTRIICGSLTAICLFLGNARSLPSQDYLEDLKGNGFPIVSLGKQNLLSLRLNATDTSIRLNFFHSIPLQRSGKQDNRDLDREGEIPDKVRKRHLGIGILLKGKTEDGWGSIFQTGKFASGFGYGLLLSFREVVFDNKKKSSNWWDFWIQYGDYYTNYKYYSPQKEFPDQIASISFSSPYLALSGCRVLSVGDNILFLSGSIIRSRTNNYGEVDKGEIKDTISVHDPGSNTTRTFSVSRGDKIIRSIESYKEFVTTVYKLNAAYIPEWSDHRIALVVYPYVESSRDFAEFRYNIGFALHFLRKSAPLNSLAGLFVELQDLANSEDSEKPFIERGIKIGFSVGLNLLWTKNP